MESKEILDNIQYLKQNPIFSGFPDIEYITSEHEMFSIGRHFAIPVFVFSTRFLDGDEIEIYDESQSLLGSLCIRESNGIIDPEKMTFLKAIAYLKDVSLADFIINKYVISKRYVVIKESEFIRYITYFAETSEVWGGFSHKESLPQYRSSPNSLTAIERIVFPTDIHKTNARRAICEPYAFERYLKKYHQLELLFDYEYVKKIRELGSDLYGIGQVLSELNRDEDRRLQFIIEKRIDTPLKISNVASKLYEISKYVNIALEILYKYKKSGNPIDESDFLNLVALPNFTEIELKNWNKARINNSDAYKKFICSIATHWIYRIRCSIAHMRIGEYIMKPEDEEFIVKFAEPLIDEVVAQCFKEWK